MEIVFRLKHQSVQSRKAWINSVPNDNDNHDCQHIWRIKRKGQNFRTTINCSYPLYISYGKHEQLLRQDKRFIMAKRDRLPSL